MFASSVSVFHEYALGEHLASYDGKLRTKIELLYDYSQTPVFWFLSAILGNCREAQSSDQAHKPHIVESRS